MQEWLNMSAAGLGRGIGAGEIDPVALAHAFLGAIESHELGDRIYARLTPERALAEAAAAAERARAGQRLSPLDGVPISWKDLFDTAGVATEAGSALLAGRVPERDCAVLRNATAMGLVCLGKTHMSELAFSGLGLNPVTATPPCVNDRGAVAGGSSSGAAASVAFGLAAAAVGSDTAGSVRIPAAWNDLVGLKTTATRLSLEGAVPLCRAFDTVGPLCRTVEDTALLAAALEGRAAPDLAGSSLRGARLARLETLVIDDADPAPLAAYRSAVDRLHQGGAHIDRIEAPELEEAHALSAILFTTQAYGEWKSVIEARPELMFPEILERFRGGAAHAGADYVAAWNRLLEIRAIWADRVAGYDAVLAPTAPILPPNLDRLQSEHDYYVSRNLLALRNTRLASHLGICAVTLPTGVGSCGIMLMGAAFGEERLLRLAAGAEKALA